MRCLSRRQLRRRNRLLRRLPRRKRLLRSSLLKVQTAEKKAKARKKRAERVIRTLIMRV